MKKLIALLLVLAMTAVMLVACGKEKDNEEKDGTEQTKTESQSTAEETEPDANVELVDPNEVFTNIWNLYAEDEKFMVIGGNVDEETWTPVSEEGPGNYDMSYTDVLAVEMVLPADQMTNVESISTMKHGMMVNYFTGSVALLMEGVTAQDYADAARDQIQNEQWMCGNPETMLIASIQGRYVLVAFGLTDHMTVLENHLLEAYPEAQILYSEDLIG